MALTTVQVKLSEETIKQLDALRGPELGWSLSAIIRQIVEESPRCRFFTPDCSADRTDEACAEPVAA